MSAIPRTRDETRRSLALLRRRRDRGRLGRAAKRPGQSMDRRPRSHVRATLADYCGVKHAIALANGSLALELALRALGIGPGDEVIVTSRSFIASASCVDIVGARPVFADVDPCSQNISAGNHRAADHCAHAKPSSPSIWPVGLAICRQFSTLRNSTNCSSSKIARRQSARRIDGRKVGSFGDARRVFVLPGQDHHDWRRRGRVAAQ